MLASSLLGAVIALAANLLDVSGEIGAVMVVLALCGAGLIGGEVSRRMPPPRRHL
jgi:hypothetical protein